ncbi:MAG: hypothetical protein KJ864_06475 [Candidatus Omnitrophica bacterium]|nr:hypothetical protein [Candidatus Omnitrophota bacterium]
MKTEKKMKIAMFRFSIIADFVNGRRLEYGEKEELLSFKENLKYEIPFSEKTDVSRESILNWIRIYHRGGNRLESLFPQTRKDKGEYHSLSPALRLSIKEIKKENPNLKLPAIIRELKHRKIIEASAKVILRRYIDF